MEVITNYILTALGSLVAYIWANRTIIPLIINWWNERKEKKKQNNIDSIEQINDYKTNVVDLSEKQFSVLLNQITALETELQQYAAELQKLRSTILRLNAKLYDKSLLITELQKKCCMVEDCPQRIHCKNYLCDLAENGDDEQE